MVKKKTVGDDANIKDELFQGTYTKSTGVKSERVK